MAFNSFGFVFFFVLIALVLAMTNCRSIRNRLGDQKVIGLRHVLLLAASYIFYACWDRICSLLLIGVSLSAYVTAGRYVKTRNKWYIRLGVVIPLIVLAVFKYFDFFVGSFCELFHVRSYAGISIMLPVGISFYTFQSLSYVIDVSRGKVEAERSFIKVALYIAFFPQLVAGPIVKAKDFMCQLYEDRNISVSRFRDGIQIFVFGLFKKIVIADNISVFVDAVYDKPRVWSGLTLFAAVVSYSVQIYCDFSGYSDMAIGSAHILGYDLKKNFDLPYLSVNVAEFWKRWHISLSTWLQEYLYIPMGGNRKGKLRTYVNNFMTMLIGGLWHGADWTFVAWGGIHGSALVVHKLWCDRTGREKEYEYGVVHRVAATMMTFLFVSFCWIFFRADSFEQAWKIISGIFTWQTGVTFVSVWAVGGVLTVMTASAAAAFRSRKKAVLEGYHPVMKLEKVWELTVFFVMIGLTLGLAYTGSNPFIYFQF